MEERLKQRLVGAVVLASLAVVFVPILFDLPREANEGTSTTGISEIPERPQDRSGSSVSVTLDLPQTLRVDAEVERERTRSASPGEGEGPDTTSNAAGTASDSSGSNAAASTAAASRNTAADATSTSSGSDAPAKLPTVSRPKTPGSRSEGATTARKADDGAGNRQAGATRAAGGWMVQLGSFQKSENALALRKRLLSKGYPAFVESGSSAQGAVSRVFVGPMPDRQQARTSAAKLQREMALEGIVVPSPGG